MKANSKRRGRRIVKHGVSKAVKHFRDEHKLPMPKQYIVKWLKLNWYSVDRSKFLSKIAEFNMILEQHPEDKQRDILEAIKKLGIDVENPISRFK